jgi:hypothetical protein
MNSANALCKIVRMHHRCFQRPAEFLTEEAIHHSIIFGDIFGLDVVYKDHFAYTLVFGESTLLRSAPFGNMS